MKMWKWAYGVICVKCVDNYVLHCHQKTLASLSCARSPPSPHPNELCKALFFPKKQHETQCKAKEIHLLSSKKRCQINDTLLIPWVTFSEKGRQSHQCWRVCYLDIMLISQCCVFQTTLISIDICVCVCVMIVYLPLSHYFSEIVRDF